MNETPKSADTECLIWTEEFAAIGNDLHLWNKNVIPWMKQRGNVYKRFAHTEAMRRGYKYSRELKEYVNGTVAVSA